MMLQLVLRVVTVALMLLCASSIDHCGVDTHHGQPAPGLASSTLQDDVTAVADTRPPSCGSGADPAHRCEMTSNLPDLDGLDPQLSVDPLTPPPAVFRCAGVPSCAQPAGVDSVLSRTCVCRT